MDTLKNVKSMIPTRQAFSLFGEFKKFALKGNVVDLAIGVIIGAAFGKIVASLVENVIMPLIGVILPGELGYEGWVITLNGKGIPVGKFVGEVVNFLIVAFSLFLFVRFFLGLLIRTKVEEVAAPPPPTKDQVLLTEIRDLLARSVGGRQ